MDIAKTKLNRNTLQSLFELHVEKSPDEVSVICENQRLTYAELNKIANQYAHAIKTKYLKQQGKPLAAGTLIGLYLEKSVSMIVGMLSIIKSGGAYVPLSPTYPKERFLMQLHDTELKILLTDSKNIKQLNNWIRGLDSPPAIINLDDSITDSDFPTSNPKCITTADDLAYVIYTSGTSGRPKGVEICHKGIVSLLHWPDFIKISISDVFLFFSDYCFDAATFEIWAPLLHGAKLVVPTNNNLSADQFNSLLMREGVTILWLTRALFDNLFTERNDIFDALSYLLVGGEALTPNLIKTLLSRTKRPLHVLNAYGPTESTTFATIFECRDIGASVPIGKDIGSRKTYILDKSGKEIDGGIQGELYIGGDGLARGYLNNKKLTDEKFVENHFVSREEATRGHTRLYKTGDLVRRRPDGNLEYIGRIDDQLKINGYRIEPKEVEIACTELLGVKQAVVMQRELGTKRFLAAYLVTPSDETLAYNEVVEKLSARLPSYMIPSTFNTIKSLPLTINGKLDQQQLPNPLFVSKNEYVAPYTTFEKRICNVWQDVLGVNPIGLNDNFFRIGGDSLTAIRLSAACRSRLQIDVSFELLVKHQTIAKIIPNIDKELLLIPKRSSNTNVLSYAQRRLLFIERLEQNISAYHIPYLAQIKKGTNLSVLERSFQVLVERHSVLKCVFTLDLQGDDSLQYSQCAVGVQRSSVESDEELMAKVNERIIQPFNLSSEMGMRISYISLHQYNFLLIVWHHVVFDGSSVEVFMRELTIVYEDLLNKQRLSLPALEIDYADYAAWQKQYLKGPIYNQLSSYWQAHLADYQILDLPIDFPRPAQFNYSGQNCYFELDAVLSEKLRALARENETTLYSILLCALYLTLHLVSGQKKIVIGTPSDNRHHPQTQPLVGFFVNSLALNVDIDANSTIREMIQKVHDVIMQGKIHQEFPFEKLVDVLAVDRDPSRHPIFQTMFSLQNFWEFAESSIDLPFEPIHMHPIDNLHSPALVDLSLFMSDLKENISGYFNYAVSLFKAESIERLIVFYKLMLSSLANNPSLLIRKLSLLSEPERHKTISTWNTTEPIPTTSKTLHNLFEEQAYKTPEKTALIFNHVSLTYDQLNNRANHLAIRIRRSYFKTVSQRICPDTLIAMYCSRGFDMVIGILAILKSGAAYIPISPDSPIERTCSILDDAGVALVLTQSSLLPEIKYYIETLDTPYELIEASSECPFSSKQVANLKPVSSARSLAYVIYTSGTTGQPNGVMMEHGASAARIAYMAKRGNARNNTYLFKTNYIFDVSVTDLFCHLLCGATVVITRSHFDMLEISSLVHRYRVNACHFVPSQLSVYSASEIKELNFSRLYFSGEDLTNEHLKKMDLVKTDVFNYYGPTETGETTSYHIQSYQNGSVIGKPFNGIKVYVLQKDLQPSPIGILGELYVSGRGLARGYHNNSDLTNSKFIQNPFECENYDHHRIMYRTGDSVRWLANGTLEYHGRNDTQVKIRGYRIELREIEGALLAMAEVKNAVVIQNIAQQYLSAYVEASWPQLFCKLEVIASLRLKLPEYMVPQSLIMIDKIPLTVNGKLDRKALPKPSTFNTLHQVYSAPRNELESGLCKIWEQVLGQKRIGIDDDFFAVGGNSFQLIKIVYRIKHEYDLDYPIKRLYTDKTIRRIVAISAKDNAINLLKESKLDDDLRACLLQGSASMDCNILITGASGFIGRHLLAELLNSTKGKIYCMSRAEDRVSGFNKIRASMKQYCIWKPTHESRIEIVIGDLSLPKLGINGPEYEQLCKQIDRVYHCATYMNHLANFDQLRNVNVTAIKHLLRFLGSGKQKYLEYMSTTGVFNNVDGRVVNENSPIDGETHTESNGYIATKWVAEKMLFLAIERGFPIKIYRLGLVSGSQAVGKNDPTQWFDKLIKTCKSIGFCFKETIVQTAVIAVDTAVHSIVKLSFSGCDKSVYHINNPANVPFVNLVKIFNKTSDSPIEMVSLSKFLDQLAAAKAQNIALPAYYIFSDYISRSPDELENLESASIFTEIENQRTLSTLKELGVQLPETNEDLIVKYFRN